jgi:putative membrane protein
MPLDLAPWNWSWHPSTVVGVGIAAVLYAWGTRLVAGNRRGWRIASFTVAMLVLLVALNGPMHDLSERYLFSAHMLQHMLLTLVVPPLILLSLPGELLDRATNPVLGPVAWLTHPVVAMLIGTAAIALWHFPFSYDAALVHHPIHIVMHLIMIAGATLLWWPAVAGGRILPRLSPGGRMLYLIGSSLPMMFVGALIALADHPLYQPYVEAPRIAALLSPLEDQRVGGLMMWVPTMVFFAAAIGVIWFRWAREEGD